MAARSDESFGRRLPGGGFLYHIAVMEEDAPGYVPVGAFEDLADAKAAAARFNERRGLSEEEAFEIYVSSIRLGPIRRSG
jgi:hypothetical protein